MHITQHKKFSPLKVFILTAFLVSNINLSVYANTPSISKINHTDDILTLTNNYKPMLLKGFTIDPNDFLKFNFIIDIGNTELTEKAFKQEAKKLIKYFLTSLTIPENEIWVNLSPYEKNRIIPEKFGKTQMGHELLSQDFMLKQLVSSLMYPESSLGRSFWDKVYQKSFDRLGKTDTPIDTFNKIWIVPELADMTVQNNSVIIKKARLKVMFEEDYLAHQMNEGRSDHGLGDVEKKDLKNDDVLIEVLREVIIPAIEYEVNQGQIFSDLRQIYQSMILATWYKQNLKQSLIGQAYVNKKDTSGMEIKNRSHNLQIHTQYVQSFKTGIYDILKEEYDPYTQRMVPRKYFSGGINFNLSNSISAYRKFFDLIRDFISGLTSLTYLHSGSFTHSRKPFYIFNYDNDFDGEEFDDRGPFSFYSSDIPSLDINDFPTKHGEEKLLYTLSVSTAERGYISRDHSNNSLLITKGCASCAGVSYLAEFEDSDSPDIMLGHMVREPSEGQFKRILKDIDFLKSLGPKKIFVIASIDSEALNTWDTKKSYYPTSKNFYDFPNDPNQLKEILGDQVKMLVIASSVEESPPDSQKFYPRSRNVYLTKSWIAIDYLNKMGDPTGQLEVINLDILKNILNSEHVIIRKAFSQESVGGIDLSMRGIINFNNSTAYNIKPDQNITLLNNLFDRMQV